MKKMLINATQPEEVRAALVDGQRLYDFNIESESQKQRKSNIYKGLVVQVSASLEAAFVDYGAERHGFLPFREIVPELLSPEGSPAQGIELVVQIDKEERGNKGASLTTYPSLPGRFLVLMPNNPRVGGVSRLVDNDEERQDALEILSQLELPQGMGLIIRTAGIGRSREELQHDLDYLMHLWQSIVKAGEDNSAPALMYEDSDAMVRILRDYLRNDISEVLIDTADFYEKAMEFTKRLLPGESQRLRLYTEPDPLFVRYQIESQIETAYSRTVSLPSGGQMVFDSTEALLSIDINSARNTAGSDIEATALNTNVEAAVEIPRQLRLRDIGGLVVIDFIDMVSNSNQRKVEDSIREHIKVDRARVQIGKISRFGLLEMSRQRLRPSLNEAHQQSCPKCRGIGYLRTISSQANAILRLIEEESFKEATAKVLVRLPVDVASVLINDKKEAIQEIEKHTNVAIMIFPSKNLDHPDYQIRRIRTVNNESDEEAEQEFHSSDPRPGNDDAFLNHAQGQSVQKGEPSVAAIKYHDVSIARPVIAPRAGEPSRELESHSGDSSIKRGLFSLFGLLGGKPSNEGGNPEEKASSEIKRRPRQQLERDGQQSHASGDRPTRRRSRGTRGGRNRRGYKDHDASYDNDGDVPTSNSSASGANPNHRQGRTSHRQGGSNRQGDSNQRQGGGYRQGDSNQRQSGSNRQGDSNQRQSGSNRQGDSNQRQSGGYRQGDSNQRQGGTSYSQGDSNQRQGGTSYGQGDSNQRQGGTNYGQGDSNQRQSGTSYGQGDSNQRQGGTSYGQGDSNQRQGGTSYGQGDSNQRQGGSYRQGDSNRQGGNRHRSSYQSHDNNNSNKYNAGSDRSEPTDDIGNR